MKIFIIGVFLGLVVVALMTLSMVVPQADHRAQIAAQDRAVYLQKMGWDKDTSR